jgi:hypothetical protein
MIFVLCPLIGCEREFESIADATNFYSRLENHPESCLSTYSLFCGLGKQLGYEVDCGPIDDILALARAYTNQGLSVSISPHNYWDENAKSKIETGKYSLQVTVYVPEYALDRDYQDAVDLEYKERIYLSRRE